MSTISSTKYGKKVGSAEQKVAQLGFDLVGTLRAEGSLSFDKDTAMQMISNESYAPEIQAQVGEMFSTLQVSVESFFKNESSPQAREITPAQATAVTYALMSAANPRAHLQRMGNKVQPQAGNKMAPFLPDHSGIDPTKLGQKSLEAYDTKPNDEMLNFTAAFALATATQNRFGEMMYKTVHLSPDQYAVEMEIPVISVHEQVRHELERRITDFNRLNVVNAELDHTILKNDTLRIIPVWRDQTKDAFVDAALIAPSDVTNENGEKIRTAPLRTNYRTSLFRVAQTDAELAKGVLDQTDALDPGAVLTAVYMAFTKGSDTEVVRIDTSNAPLNQFTESSGGMTRRMDLQFVTDAVVIGKHTKLHNGAPSTLLSAFEGDNGLTAWLSFSVRGDISLQDSSYEIISGSVEVSGMQNAAGQNLDIAAAGQKDLVDLLKSGKVIAVDIDVRKVNSNLRELGQLADFNTYRQIYGVSLGSPLSVQRPIMNGDSQDALHSAALAYLCKARQSNMAVTTLEGEVETLRQYKKRTNIVGRQPEIMGISSFLVEPVLEELEVDLAKDVTSTTQHERVADVRAILTDACQIVAYKLWQKSNWQSAANLLEGVEASLPVVKLGTDMVLTQYLMINGDTRTVGPDFTYEKAWTPDLRVRDKIYVALGYPSQNPGVPHPLDKGMMLNKPEVVAALNLSRGSHSRELIVHPSFRHIPLCPVLGLIHVKGLKEALTTKATLGVEVTNAADFPVSGGTPTP